MLRLAVVPDQRFENRQHVPPKLHDAEEAAALLGFALGFAVPLGEHVGGHLDVAPQFLRRMAPQEETVEERRFAVRIFQLVLAFDFVHRKNRPDIGRKLECTGMVQRVKRVRANN